MNDLVGQGGELRFTVTIKRKETGEVETHELVGRVTPEQEQQLIKEHSNGDNTQHSGT